MRYENEGSREGLASTPTTLFSFNGSNGSNPHGGLITDASGDLFGTTATGGANGVGTVFEIARTGGAYAATPTTLVSFNGNFSNGGNGISPEAGLTTDAAGDLFGTTEAGGAFGDGTVFEIARTSGGYASTPTTLVSFKGSNGSLPYSGLIADASGDLFGTTKGGGTSIDGTVFEIVRTSSGYASTPTVLANFNYADGANPDAGLIADAAGNLFGTTNSGGNGDGTVFEIARTSSGYASTPATLASFNLTNGSGPVASLIADAAGDLFGTTQSGGANMDGTVFELTGTGFQVVSTGLLGGLNTNQQLELIYVAYFNRAADGGGFTFWEGQNAQAQNTGQSAALALTNIANSYAPQPETEALYPSLDPYVGTPTPPSMNTTVGQAALTTFITAVFNNLFSRAPDSAGEAYWVGQITGGAVGPGAAALAIANGATGTDAIEVQNKIAVAMDFTTRTASAGLGQTGPLPAAFLTAARSALNGVDGTALNDASVTAGMNATTTYIAGASTGHQTAAVGAATSRASSATGSVDPNVIIINESSQLVDPGAGDHTIAFIAGARGDTLVLHLNSLDQVSGFDPTTDVLDVRSLFAAASIDPTGGDAALGDYLTVSDQGTNALVSFDPTGHGGGSTVVVLQGLGSSVTGLDSLIAQGALRIA